MYEHLCPFLFSFVTPLDNESIYFFHILSNTKIIHLLWFSQNDPISFRQATILISPPVPTVFSEIARVFF